MTSKRGSFRDVNSLTLDNHFYVIKTLSHDVKSNQYMTNLKRQNDVYLLPRTFPQNPIKYPRALMEVGRREMGDSFVPRRYQIQKIKNPRNTRDLDSTKFCSRIYKRKKRGLNNPWNNQDVSI